MEGIVEHRTCVHTVGVGDITGLSKLCWVVVKVWHIRLGTNGDVLVAKLLMTLPSFIHIVW